MTTSKRASWSSFRASRPCCCASTSSVVNSAAVRNRTPIVVLAAGHAQGDGEMGLAGTDAADQHDVGSLGDEGAAAHLQDRIAVQLRLRVELEGIQGLEHREAGLLEAALDAALAAPGHFQVHQLREVLRGRLALAGGLGGASVINCW